MRLSSLHPHVVAGVASQQLPAAALQYRKRHNDVSSKSRKPPVLPAGRMAPRLLSDRVAMSSLVDEALEAISTLPSPPAFRAWCAAYREGRFEEETVKRAFRSVWMPLANGRFDDFRRIMAHAETRLRSLKREQIAGWAQAAASRAVLELMWAEQVDSADAADERRERAAAIAAAALRFARAAASSAGRRG